MLKSNFLDSALTPSTIAPSFMHYGKKLNEDKISIEQAIMCFNFQSREGGVAVDDAMNNSSVSATPVMVDVGQRGEEVPLDFSGPRIGDWS